MADLEFVRISPDNTRIIVRDSAGRESALPMDDRLATALIPRTSPAGDAMALSPREIQARIRSGADVQGLADQTGTPVDRIMAFAVPILQERAHIATRARTTHVRRTSGEGALEDVIVARLSPLGIALVDTAWDARRLDDGRWEIHLSYETREGVRSATWLFDARAAVIAPSNDEAHWLMGEAPVTQAAERPVPTKQTLPVFKTVDAPDNVVPMKRKDEAEDIADEVPQLDPEDEAPIAPVAPTAPPAEKPASKGRRSIPSWDEILFGSPSDEQ